MAKRMNGEGTFRTLPSGRIQLRVQKGYLPSGVPRILCVSGDTARECKMKMEARLAALPPDLQDMDITRMTVTELCRLHLSKHMSQRGKLKATAADRRECTINNQLANFRLGHLQAGSVRPSDIELHIESLLSEGRLSVSTIEKAFHVVNGAYKWAVDQGQINYNPCTAVKETLLARFNGLSAKEADDADVIVLSEEEMSQLKEAAMRRNKKGKLVDITGLYVLLLLATGMRVGELCALHWKDMHYQSNGVILTISQTRHYVKKRGKEGEGFTVKENIVKNAHSRHIVLSEDAIKILEMIYTENSKPPLSQYILVNTRGNPTNPSNMGYMINRFYQKAGLSEEITGAHILRRTFATNQYQQGAPIKKIASYIGDLESTTSQYYIAIKRTIRSNGETISVVPMPLSKEK